MVSHQKASLKAKKPEKFQKKKILMCGGHTAQCVEDDENNNCFRNLFCEHSSIVRGIFATDGGWINVMRWSIATRKNRRNIMGEIRAERCRFRTAAAAHYYFNFGGDGRFTRLKILMRNSSSNRRIMTLGSINSWARTNSQTTSSNLEVHFERIFFLRRLGGLNEIFLQRRYCCWHNGIK